MIDKIITNKTKMTIAVLVVLLVVSISYIVINKYQETKQKEQLNIFQQGAQYGYEQAIIQIVQQLSTCQQVPLIIQNQTINAIAAECLQQTQK